MPWPLSEERRLPSLPMIMKANKVVTGLVGTGLADEAAQLRTR